MNADWLRVVAFVLYFAILGQTVAIIWAYLRYRRLQRESGINQGGLLLALLGVSLLGADTLAIFQNYLRIGDPLSIYSLVNPVLFLATNFGLFLVMRYVWRRFSTQQTSVSKDSKQPMTTNQDSPPLTRLQTVVMFLFIVAAFAAVAYRTEVVLGQTKKQNDGIERVLEVTRDAAVGHEEAAKELIDCNTPGGECYRQTQADARELEAAVAESRERIIAAALVCNDRPGGENEKILTACLDKLLKEPR